MNRIASLLVAIPFLGYFASLYGQKGILLGFAYIALPLACIWFPDSMGGATGTRMGSLTGPEVTKASPGCLVRIVGWLLLLVVVGTKVYLTKAG